MTGETNLTTLLSGLHPELDPRPFGVIALPPGGELPDGLRPIGWFEEAEGLTVIATIEDLERAGLEPGAAWARITLTVHSSLEAVGLTAVVATALARHGVSANVVAAFHHDHIFTPWDRRNEALLILRQGEKPAIEF